MKNFSTTPSTERNTVVMVVVVGLTSLVMMEIKRNVVDGNSRIRMKEREKGVRESWKGNLSCRGSSFFLCNVCLFSTNDQRRKVMWSVCLFVGWLVLRLLLLSICIIFFYFCWLLDISLLWPWLPYNPFGNKQHHQHHFHTTQL